jgi:repressor LexA
MDYPLTPKQKQVLDSIRQYLRQKGYMPTVRDLCRMTKLAIGTVSDHLNILERKGWIKVDGSPRGIHLTEEPTDKVDTVAVPLVGTITAGSPIEAIEVPEDPIVLPKAVAKPGSFALRVQGDSMVDDHILNGDLVVVFPQPHVNNGEIAIALLEDGTATLKRIYRGKGRIRLQPANARMKPIYVKNVTIQGKVTSVLRIHKR